MSLRRVYRLCLSISAISTIAIQQHPAAPKMYTSSPCRLPEPYVSLTTSLVKVGFQILLSRCSPLCHSWVDAVRWNPRRSSCKGRCGPTWKMLHLSLDMPCFQLSQLLENIWALLVEAVWWLEQSVPDHCDMLDACAMTKRHLWDWKNNRPTNDCTQVQLTWIFQGWQ